MLINADVGERTADDVIDLQLMEDVDILNIALGAHAGDAKWSQELCARAVAANKKVCLHPGYADREHFGRRELDLSFDSLRESLDLQRAVLPQITACKFHGAIYNRAITDEAFANQLAQWCVDAGVNELLTPADSCLAETAAVCGIDVMREAFVDRRYCLQSGRLVLASRGRKGAVIEDETVAVQQASDVVTHGRVQLMDGGYHPIECDTICIHGDRSGASELAKRLRKLGSST